MRKLRPFPDHSFRDILYQNPGGNTCSPDHRVVSVPGIRTFRMNVVDKD